MERKRFLAVVMTVMMVISMIPSMVFAAAPSGELGGKLKIKGLAAVGVVVSADYAKESDLFICEGMYGEDDKADKARGYKHMTFREAAVLARDARVKEMWLTHYSPSLVRPDEFMDKVREIFPNAYPGKDGKSLELNFEE